MSASTPDLDDELDDLLNYQGETKARARHVATALTFVSPGLGYVYIGRLGLGAAVNAAFLIPILVFAFSVVVFGYFPLLPALVMLVGWVVFCGLVALDVRERIVARDIEHEYVLESYNHWLIYALFVGLGWLAPLGVTAELVEGWGVTTAAVEHAGMYPTLLSGDVVLIDRRGFEQAPERGDVVAVSSKKPGAPTHVLRVVGVHEDTIRVEGDLVFIDDLPVVQLPYPEDEVELDRPEMLAMVEHNEDERYLISRSRRAITNVSIAPTRLGPDQLFLLTDNRSQVPLDDADARIRDSRDFGALAISTVVGAPRYVLWSSDPDGQVRWNRIGVRIQ